MPRRSEEAYTITYAVLGLLARWGATSGYDLKRAFDQGMGRIWEVTHSQIYNELRRLKRNGWADMETQEQETRPDRKVYHITDAGREALAIWLHQPAELPHIHDELALKIILGSFAPTKALIDILRAAVTTHQQQLADLYHEQDMHGDSGDSALWQQPITSDSQRDPYIGLVVRLGLSFEEMYLRWLDESIRLLEQNKR